MAKAEGATKMKLTRAEAESLLELVEVDLRTRYAQQRSVKRTEKLRDKLQHYLTLKGLPTK